MHAAHPILRLFDAPVRSLRRALPGKGIVAFDVPAVRAEPSHWSIAPRALRALLTSLLERFPPLSTGSLLDVLRGQEQLFEERALLTFSRADRDFVEHALPILREFRAPAVLFVTTGACLDRDPPWYEIPRSLLHAGGVAPADLGDLGRKLVDAKVWGAVTDWTPYANRFGKPSRSAEEAVDRLTARIAALPEEVRWKAMEIVRAEVPDTVFEGLRDEYLDAEALRELPEAEVELGSQTVSYPNLSRTDPVRADAEMRGSKAALERAGGRPVRLLAYPGGRPGDLGPTHADLARAAGYRAAFTREGTSLRPGFDDPLRLGRVSVEAADPAAAVGAAEIALTRDRFLWRSARRVW